MGWGKAGKAEGCGTHKRRQANQLKGIQLGQGFELHIMKVGELGQGRQDLNGKGRGGKAG